MTSIEEYKEQRLKELYARLEEINQITRPDVALNLIHQEDEFSYHLLKKQTELLKKYHNEVVDINQEIARLKGEKSILEGQYI